MIRYVLLLVISVVSLHVMGQSYMKLTPVKDTVLVGEVFKVMVDSRFSNNEDAYVKFNNLDSIPNLLYQQDTINFNQYADYSIVDGGPLNISSESELNIDNFLQNSESTSFKMAIYDPGIYRIIPPDIIGSEAMPVQSSLLVVTLPDELMNRIQDSIAVAPIKDIISEPLSFEDFKGPLYGLSGLLALLGVFFLITRWKNKEVVEEKEEEVIIPAHEIALKKLNKLSEEETAGILEEKQFQSNLTFIIREYLENRFGISALESTSAEIIREIPPEVNIDDLKKVLQIADLVKFAKAKPPKEIHNEFLEIAYRIVNKTKKVVVEE